MHVAVGIGILLVAITLAGCAAERPAPSAAEEQTAVDSRGAGVTFEKCIGWVHVAYVPADWVDAALPEGYATARGFNAGGLPTPDVGVTYPALSAYQCKSITMPDGTVYPEARFARSTVYLGQAGGHEADKDNHYLFEMFLDRARLPGFAAFLDGYGWLVHDAQVELGDRQFDVRSNDGIAYSARPDPIPADDPPDPRDSLLRLHHVAGNGTASFSDFGDTLYLSFTYYSVLSATGGFFGTLAPAEGDATLPGVGQGHGVSGPAIWSWADSPMADPERARPTGSD